MSVCLIYPKDSVQILNPVPETPGSNTGEAEGGGRCNVLPLHGQDGAINTLETSKEEARVSNTEEGKPLHSRGQSHHGATFLPGPKRGGLADPEWRSKTR